MTFFKALWIRYKLLKGEAIPVKDTMPLALRYRWLFVNRWFYSPSVKFMLAMHDGTEELRRQLKRGMER